MDYDVVTRSFLVIGQKMAALVDGGAVGTELQVLGLLDELGIPRRLRLILLTHVHSDHVAAAGPLQEATGCMIAVHRAGADMLRDSRLRLREYREPYPVEFPLSEESRQKYFANAGPQVGADIRFSADGFSVDLGGLLLVARLLLAIAVTLLASTSRGVAGCSAEMP